MRKIRFNTSKIENSNVRRMAEDIKDNKPVRACLASRKAFEIMGLEAEKIIDEIGRWFLIVK